MGAAILNLDRDRKLLNADVISAYPVDLKSVQHVQKHINKCEQIIVTEHNATALLKLYYEWHTPTSVWARRNLTTGRWFKMAQKLTPKRNYNPRQYRDRRCDVRAFQFAPSCSNMLLLLLLLNAPLFLRYSMYWTCPSRKLVLARICNAKVKHCFV